MKIDKRIKKEIENSTPDLADQIVKSVNWDNIKNANTQKENKQPKHYRLHMLMACCAVFICLIIGVPLYFHFDKPLNYGYTITIDVNPSIRLVANSNDIIVEQYGLNPDGVVLLYKENYIGKNVEVASAEIMDKLNLHGFLEENDVKIYVKNEKGKKDGRKQEEIISIIEPILANFGKGKLEVLDESELEFIENEYDDEEISEYEKNIINKYTETVLALAKEKQNDLSSLIEKLTPYAEDSKEIINPFPIASDILEFVDKYKYVLEFDLDKVCGDDICDLQEDLQEDLDDLTQAIIEIETEDKDEDDFEDLLEDIFELVEDFLLKENKN